MNQNRDKIMALVKKNWSKVEKLSVKKLGLFGSFARNEGGETSDIDFLVEFEKKSYDNYMDLKIFLEDLLACKVDLVIREAIKPRLRDAILSEVIYAT
ncbi:MAG: nucleotidyltransferase family protein [Chlamydiae bacterium]|nr:nucleotidyltransferase family protein [Chlamydiota bacterium]